MQISLFSDDTMIQTFNVICFKSTGKMQKTFSMTSTLTLNISCDLLNKEDFKMFKTIMKIRVKVLSTLKIQSEGTIYTKHSE